MAKTVVRARIDATIKDEAAAVLAAMGLTVSDAFRLLLVRIARERPCRSSPWSPTLRPSRLCKRHDAGNSSPSAVWTSYSPISMRTIKRTTHFKRDYKRIRAGRHRATLDEDLRAVVTLLATDTPLPPRYRDHPLIGD